MDARRRGFVLFWLAFACFMPAVVLGLSKHGDPIWGTARALFVPSGAVLMIYGVLVWRKQARWIGLGADEPRRPGSILLALGLAAFGFGLAYVTGAGGWHLLMIPALVGGGLLSLREAWRGKRGWFYRINTLERTEWWLARAGLWMFGLTWPLLVLWALGLQSIE